MSVGGDVVGAGIAPPPAPTTAPGTGGTVRTLNSTQLNAGQVLDATSDRFLVFSCTATSGGGFAALNIGPDSLHTVSVIGAGSPAGANTAVGVYVPKGWFVQAGQFNATFRDCQYW